MPPETDSNTEAAQLCWVRGGEAAVLELLFDAILMLVLYLFRQTWPGVVSLRVCVVLGFLLLLGMLLRFLHHLSRSGQEESIDLSSLGTRTSESWRSVMIASKGKQQERWELFGWMWWSPVCVVLKLRDASHSRARLLVIWRYRVGESSYRLLRRRLKSRLG